MPVTKHYVRYRRKLGRRQVDHVMQQVRIRRLISWRRPVWVGNVMSLR